MTRPNLATILATILVTGRRAVLRLSRGRSVLLAAVAAFATSAAASGRFGSPPPQPIPTAHLVEALAPLLIEVHGAWTAIFTAHDEYLEASRLLRETQVEPWCRRVDPLRARLQEGTPPDPPELLAIEGAERRLGAAQSAIDDRFFAAIVQALETAGDLSPAPAIEWLRLRRVLEVRDCGVDEQTADVPFSLLSYGDLALAAPCVVWAEPGSARGLVQYEAGVLRMGLRHLRDRAERRHAAVAASQATAPFEWPTFTFDSGTSDGELGDGGEDAMAEPGTEEGESVVIDMEPGDAAELAARDHATRLARFGRRSLTTIEAALPARARLLYRIRLFMRVGNLDHDDRQTTAEEVADGRPLGTLLQYIQSLLEEAIHPATRGGIDIGAVEAIAAAHWSAAAPLADELLQITRRRSDVLFATGRHGDPESAVRDEHRRALLVERWQELAEQALAALEGVVQQSKAIAAQAGAAQDVPLEVIASHIISSRVGTAARGATKPWEGSIADSPRDIEALRSRLTEHFVFVAEGATTIELGGRILHLEMGRAAAAPDGALPTLVAARVVDALALDVARDPVSLELAELVRALCAESVVAAEAEREELQRRESEAAAIDTGDPRSGEAYRALIDAKVAAVRRIDQRLLAEIAPLLEGEEAQLRLALLDLSSQLAAALPSHEELDLGVGRLLDSVDLADALLGVGFGGRGWTTNLGDWREQLASPWSEGVAPAPPSSGARSAARFLLSRREELVAGRQAIAAAMAAWLRLRGREAAEAREPESAEARRGGPLAAAKAVVLAVLRRQAELEAEMVDSMAALCTPEEAIVLRRVARRAALSAELRSVSVDERRLREIREDASSDLLLGELHRIDAALAPQLDRLDSLAVEAALAAGAALDQTDWPAEACWQRREAALGRAATELYSRAIVDLARGPARDDPALQSQLGFYRWLDQNGSEEASGDEG